MSENDPMKPYRIGYGLRLAWKIVGDYPWRHRLRCARKRRTIDLWRRRWQSEHDDMTFLGARRAWTPSGARRRMSRAVARHLSAGASS